MSSGKVKCTCGWSWNKSDSSKKDMYICHECGRDNSNNMKNGGWLDNYNDSQASAPEGMVGDGYSNVGRDYSPAWGGQFEMGGSIPGSVGFTYARTQSPAPSNGKYAKKTMASAQNGVTKFNANKFIQDRKADTPLQRSLNKEIQSEDYRKWVDTKEYKDQVKANKIAQDKATIADRKSRILKSETNPLNKGVGVLNPSNWSRENWAESTGAIGDKFRMFPEDPDSFIDEWMNPAVMIGNMASDLGTAPLRAQQEDSYMPYVTSVGVPLLTGGLEGLGAKTNKQFISNVVNPLNMVPGYHSAEKAIGKKLGNIPTSITPELRQGLETNGFSDFFKRKPNPDVPNYRLITDEDLSISSFNKASKEQVKSINENNIYKDLAKSKSKRHDDLIKDIDEYGEGWKYSDEDIANSAKQATDAKVDWRNYLDAQEARIKTNPELFNNTTDDLVFYKGKGLGKEELQQLGKQNPDQWYGIQEYKGTRPNAQGYISDVDDYIGDAKYTLPGNRFDRESMLKDMSEDASNSFNKFYKNQNWKPNIKDIPMNKNGGTIAEYPEAQFGALLKKGVKAVGNEAKFVKKAIETSAKDYHSLLKDLPKAKSLKEVAGRFAGLPIEGSLPRLSPQELKIFRQVQEIGRLRATGKPISKQYQYALEQGLPEEHLKKVFGKTKAEIENAIPNAQEQEAFRLANPFTDRINLQRPPRRTSSSDAAIDQMNASAVAPLGSDQDIQNIRAMFDHLSSAPVRQNNLSMFRLDPDQLAHFNSPHSSGSFNYGPGKVENFVRETLSPLESVHDKASSKFINAVQDYPYHQGPVMENVPSLSLSGSGSLKNVSDKVSNAGNVGMKSGDIYTGSLNTSHSSYLPQLKQVFKSTEGAPQFFGYKPMNSMGFLSDYHYSKDDIAKYLNTEIDEQIKRGIIPGNVQRPFVKGENVQLPHYGIKQFRGGGIIKDDRGQWDHPGEITEIDSNDITMEGVPYDVLGISDTGDIKMMKPGKNYKFKGKKVTEYPMAKNGLRQEQKGLQNLDNLTNFTNYNTKQPGGWLDNLM